MDERIQAASARSIATWGAERQLRKLQEECSELAAAIAQYIDGRTTAEELASEVADVRITLQHAVNVLGQGVVNSATEAKLSRLLWRMGRVK